MELSYISVCIVGRLLCELYDRFFKQILGNPVVWV